MALRLSSPHVHTQFCDGKSTAADMARSAFEKGFVSLGFSSHSHLDFDPKFAMRFTDEPVYIEEITRLAQEYAGRMKIWAGLEADSFSAFDRARFQYVIASMHYLKTPDGYYLPMDADASLLQDGIIKYFGGDGVAMAKSYFAHLGAHIRETKPDIIGHYDLIMKNNRDFSLFDADSPQYRKAATDAMDEAFSGCSLMEVNTGAMARWGHPVPYPEIGLLRYWRAVGGRVILSSDCHNAKDIMAGYDVAEQVIRQAGYREVWLLGTGDEVFEAARLSV